MGTYEEMDDDIMSFGENDKINVRVYCGGAIPPQIHIIEKYDRSADGVQEGGGRFISAVRYVDDLQAEEFANRLSQAVHEEGLLTPYVEAGSTRRRIQKIAKEIDAQLRLDVDIPGIKP
ncbi:hypothetical protein [Sulfitobacter sp. R18_1]|uniref:hypothetical protein n=1 Tax=Sulfitobacter sp. R18_1 TaxID=2821104 RepID=UPI001AD9D209|nr:hypothetical protein [Sulfitobacter sp. R18_1]MBO9428254.1 hypothetical protein [Sulfitobacter sp. R18_1]